MKEFEKSVPAFICRPPKKYVTCPNDDISGRNCVFVVFDIESSCGGKQAEILQLAAQNERGETFSRFTVPERNISPHATRVNKFQATWFGGKKVLHRGGILLETVGYNECLKSFVDFLQESSNVRDIQSSSVNTVLIGHNSNSFDTPLLLREQFFATIQNSFRR